MLPSSGTLSLSGFQNEFGGSNPISMSEYYQGGAYTTANNDEIPTSGPISVSSFYSAFKVATVSEITDAIVNNPVAVRNALFSRNAIDYGFESDSAVSFNGWPTGGTHRYDTSIWGVLSFPSSFNSAFAPCLATSVLTFILINSADAVGNSRLWVNGIERSWTDVLITGYTHKCNIKIGQLSVLPRALEGLQVQANITKGSANKESRQQVIVLPGRWSAVYVNQTSGTLSNFYTAQTNDIVLGLNQRLYDNPSSGGDFSSTGGLARIISSRYWWYSSSHLSMHKVTSAGTLTYNASGLPEEGSSVLVLRCTEV